MRHRWLKAALALAAAAWAAAALGVDARPAGAALLCGGSAGTQVFLPWLDPASYTLAPGGSFESGSPAWSLSRGATLAAANDPFFLSRPGTRSLALDAGESATSPTYCVSATQVDLRLVASGSGTVRVDVLGSSALGLSLLDSAAFSVGPAWAPSPLLPFTNGLLGPTAQNVVFRIAAVSGSVLVDDVYVDPFYCR